MASDAQHAANIENAKKSTGPNTEEGKAKSSQNALKTGIDAKCEVIKFESRPEYDALISEFYHRFRPTNPEERSLVDALIRSEWLSRRYMCVETGVWAREFNSSDHDELGTAFSRHAEVFARIERRQNSAQRNFQRALAQLMQLRAKRKVIEKEPLNQESALFLVPIPGPSETTVSAATVEEEPPLAA